jgi:pilus assembly protein CpaF
MAVIPPTAIEGPCLSLRRAAHEALTWERLLGFGALTTEAHEFILRAVRASVSILIAGGTGSGKTTVANLVAGSIPAEKHVVVVEQRHEMRVQHPRRIYLEAGGPANISFMDLFDTAEQLRPEWVVVGEMRGPEALRALQSMSVGYTGLVNLHAESLEDALARLEAMCLMANMGLGLSEIRGLIASALHLLIYQQRLHDGRRRITHVVELRGVEHDRFQLQPLFRYDPDADRLEAIGAQPTWERQERS